MLIRDLKVVAVRGPVTTLVVITLAVIKTFLIKWRPRWMTMPMIWQTEMPLFEKVKPQS